MNYNLLKIVILRFMFTNHITEGPHKIQIDLSEKTKDYNIGTSLRNYIDPRVFKAWTDEVGAEWEKLYTSALQKKFLWVKNENVDWKSLKN